MFVWRHIYADTSNEAENPLVSIVFVTRMTILKHASF